MATSAAYTKHHLSGDWTISGVVTQMDSLSVTLQKIASSRDKNLHVDCTSISKIDMCGLQLLQVWTELVKMRGVIVQLVNLPDDMHQSIQRMGLGQSFTICCPDDV